MKTQTLHEANKIYNETIKLEDSRDEFKTSFDQLSKVKDGTTSDGKPPCDFLEMFFFTDERQKNQAACAPQRNEFPIEELLRLYEYRIKQIDFRLEELLQKFEKL